MQVIAKMLKYKEKIQNREGECGSTSMMDSPYFTSTCRPTVVMIFELPHNYILNKVCKLIF